MIYRLYGKVVVKFGYYINHRPMAKKILLSRLFYKINRSGNKVLAVIQMYEDPQSYNPSDLADNKADHTQTL